MVVDRFRKRFGPAVLEEILRALSSITHGSVQIIVQDSKVVQIDKIEKVRLDKAKRQQAEAP